MNHNSLIMLITHYGYAGIFVSLFIGIVGLPLPIFIIRYGLLSRRGLWVLAGWVLRGSFVRRV